MDTRNRYAFQIGIGCQATQRRASFHHQCFSNGYRRKGGGGRSFSLGICCHIISGTHRSRIRAISIPAPFPPKFPIANYDFGRQTMILDVLSLSLVHILVVVAIPAGLICRIHSEKREIDSKFLKNEFKILKTKS